MRYLFVFCLLFLSAFALADPAQAKLPPWEDVDGNQFAHKNIIKPKLGEIHFKNGKVVRFSDLTSKDQKRARDLWGFKIIELNGIFRSNTGTLYAINEVAGEKVAVTMIDSPVFAKVEGTFERDKKFLQSRQWHIKFKKLHPINEFSLESRIRINKKGDVIAEVPKYILLPNGQIKLTKDFVKIRLEPVPYSHVPLRVRNTECRECDNAKGVQQIIIACRLIHLRNKRGILARQCLIQIIREKFPTLAKQDVLAIVDILVGLLVKPPEFKNDNDLEEKIKQRIQMRAVRLSKNTDVINFCMRFAKSAAPDTL